MASKRKKMNESAVEIKGLKELNKALRQAADEDLKKEIKAAHLEAAKAVADQAKFEIPVRSGRLRDSIRATGTLKGGLVRAGSARVPYAGPIHFGWKARNIRPQPFIYEALDKRIGDVLAAYEKSLQDVASKI